MGNTLSSRTYPKSLTSLNPLNSLKGKEVKAFKGFKGLSPSELLANFKASGFELFADGEQLRWRGPAGVLTDDDRATLRECKPVLLELLKREDVQENARDTAQDEVLALRSQQETALQDRVTHAHEVAFIITTLPSAKMLKGGAWRIEGAKYLHDDALQLALDVERSGGKMEGAS